MSGVSHDKQVGIVKEWLDKLPKSTVVGLMMTVVGKYSGVRSWLYKIASKWEALGDPGVDAEQ